MVKNPPANAGDATDADLIPGSGRSPGVGDGNPLQYSCLENSTDRGAWQATVYWVAESDMTEHACVRARAHTHTHTHTHSEFEKCRHLRPQPRLLHVCMYVQLLHSCLTLSNTMNCSPPGTFVHGILQARILEWVAIPSPGDL